MAVRLKDVAARAGVSVKTVSNVVDDYPHVTAATRKKVVEAIEWLGYRPNLSARNLRRAARMRMLEARLAGADDEPQELLVDHRLVLRESTLG